MSRNVANRTKSDLHAHIGACDHLNSPLFDRIPFTEYRITELWAWIIACIGSEIDVLNHILVESKVFDSPLRDGQYGSSHAEHVGTYN